MSAAGVIAVHAACSSDPPSSPVTAVAATDCLGKKDFTRGRVFGTSLPPHTLALTFDDGPSERTPELAAYLDAQGIEAGFFVNGMFVAQFPTVLPQVVAHGHLIANHTQNHQDLTDPAFFPASPAGDAALVDSVAQTDALIAPFLESGRRLFRAPYGRWDDRAFDLLAASPMSTYVGPIDWDIGDSRTATTAADWACWQNAPALSTKECGDLTLAQITAVDRGIVLMHDAAYGDETNHALATGVGNTVDMVKYIVPVLKAAGFSFVRIDHVPEIEAKLPPLVPDAGGGGNDASTPPSLVPADGGSADVGMPSPGPSPPTDPCASGNPRSRGAHAH